MDGCTCYYSFWQRYVELMSSAVLAGANLTDLITNTEDLYIEKAVQLAHKIEWLRSNRSHWRNQLINSDLYDTTSLCALEQSFADMAVMTKIVPFCKYVRYLFF